MLCLASSAHLYGVSEHVFSLLFPGSEPHSWFSIRRAISGMLHSPLGQHKDSGRCFFPVICFLQAKSSKSLSITFRELLQKKWCLAGGSNLYTLSFILYFGSISEAIYKVFGAVCCMTQCCIGSVTQVITFVIM